MIENGIWAVYKVNIWILFPYRIAERRGEGDSFVVTPVIINLLTGFKEIVEEKVWVKFGVSIQFFE